MESVSRLMNGMELLKSVTKGVSVAAGIVFLVGCDSSYTENNYANSYDIEGNLSKMLESYAKTNPDYQTRGNVNFSELKKMEDVSMQILYTLSRVEKLDSKLIIIDIDGPTGVVLNEVLKTAGYNTSLNYMVNWSDKVNQIHDIDYSRFFSVVSKIKLTLPDKHVVDKTTENGVNHFHTKPWAVILDYGRMPVSIDTLNSSNFHNYYVFLQEHFPKKDLFVSKSDSEAVRDGVIVFSYGQINADLSAYLDDIYSVNQNIQVVSFNSKGDLPGISSSDFNMFLNDFAKYDYINNSANTSNGTSGGSGSSTRSHSGGGGYYSYYHGSSSSSGTYNPSTKYTVGTHYGNIKSAGTTSRGSGVMSAIKTGLSNIGKSIAKVGSSGKAGSSGRAGGGGGRGGG